MLVDTGDVIVDRAIMSLNLVAAGEQFGYDDALIEMGGRLGLITPTFEDWASFEADANESNKDMARRSAKKNVNVAQAHMTNKIHKGLDELHNETTDLNEKLSDKDKQWSFPTKSVAAVLAVASTIRMMFKVHKVTDAVIHEANADNHAAAKELRTSLAELEANRGEYAAMGEAEKARIKQMSENLFDDCVREMDETRKFYSTAGKVGKYVAAPLVGIAKFFLLWLAIAGSIKLIRWVKNKLKPAHTEAAV